MYCTYSSSKLSILYIDYNVLKAGLLCKEVRFIPWEWEEELEPLILEHFGLSMFHAWINTGCLTIGDMKVKLHNFLIF